MSERSKESKEQKKNKGSVLVAESAYSVLNTQFDLVMFLFPVLGEFYFSRMGMDDIFVQLQSTVAHHQF